MVLLYFLWYNKCLSNNIPHDIQSYETNWGLFLLAPIFIGSVVDKMIYQKHSQRYTTI